MTKLTVEVDLIDLIDRKIGNAIDQYMNENSKDLNYRRHLTDVISDKLAEKFINKYSQEIFSNIAKDETLTILIREKVIADIAQSFRR